MWASCPCFQLCLVFAILYPEAIVTPFLFSVSYHVHSGAIVAVFLSGLRETQDRGGHKTVMHRKATAQHKLSITVFIVHMCEKIDNAGCKGCYHGCPALDCRTGPLAPRGNSPLAEGHQVLWCPSSLFP